ncbi:MAG: YggT family protein [Thermodesulfobacteriota bacterium]|nr:YggT family protein [Thermodesulfobacteriota bacterium]
MFIIGNFLYAIASVIKIVLQIYAVLIIVRAIISWVNPDPFNPVVQFLYRSTEPVLSMVRRYLPGRGFGIDISPIIVILVIIFLQEFLVNTLFQIADKLK